MRVTGVKVGLAALVMSAVAMPPARATTMLQMNLEQLSTRSDRIFRGTVIYVERGALSAGGGTVPTVTYRVRVDEEFKGKFEPVKEGVTVVEIRMVAAAKEDAKLTGGVRHVSLFRDVPRLESGKEYLLFMTAQSRIGLSTTVGLGQGAFGLVHQGKDKAAVNGVDNAGLFRGMQTTARFSGRGPITYSELASRLRAILGR